MMKWLVERRLRSLTLRIGRAREELSVLDEQIVHFADQAEYANTKSLVSDSPADGIESFHANRSAQTLVKARAVVAKNLDAMRAEQDRLLDQLSSS